ncbi:hypothetical protein [Burkholderia sp. Ac-20379]|uniref:hypothetical protein n=1 Tax=Burkholderia sp. Ac-20379 TaxID=2703900 RepID=UPI00197ED084|nr:hypothetical protein [Burkholderia sp. Ac-20379]MBN3722626.1 hypothetical protein [Burkholderia sp. Ac-20379]
MKTAEPMVRAAEATAPVVTGFLGHLRAALKRAFGITHKEPALRRVLCIDSGDRRGNDVAAAFALDNRFERGRQSAPRLFTDG